VVVSERRILAATKIGYHLVDLPEQDSESVVALREEASGLDANLDSPAVRA